jgi:flagellar biosynthesis activator protein FlaF
MQPATHEMTGTGMPEISPAAMRSAEREMLVRVTRALEVARDANDQGAIRRAATQNQTLWMLFVTEMFSETNGLPADLRQRIAQVGMSVIREINDNLHGTLDVDFLVEINQAIIDGLAAKA